MKKRFLYALLFGVPGVFVALVVAFVAFGGLAGILWIFVFGDNPWPSFVESLLPILLVSVFLVVWVSLIILGYRVGMKLEGVPGLNRMHVLLSSGLTLLFIGIISLQQLRAGNIGPKSDDTVCSEYCTAQGYSGSGLPPLNSGDRTCSCYDNSGNAVLKTPLDRIEQDRPK